MNFENYNAFIDEQKIFFKENIKELKPNKPKATYLIWIDCRDFSKKHEDVNFQDIIILEKNKK